MAELVVFAILAAIGYGAYRLVTGESTAAHVFGWIMALFVGVSLINLSKEGAAEFFRERREDKARAEAERAAEEEREKAHREQEREQREKARQRDEALEQSRRIEEAKRDRERKLREFALNEAPVLWKTYQGLEAEIVAQNKRIVDLAEALREFDKIPEKDSDYIAICSTRDEMVSTRESMRRKILEDGIREAEAASRRYRHMAETK